MAKYRIAILECDTPLETVRNKLGTYGDIFERFLRRGLEQSKGNGGASQVELEVTKSNVVENGELPDLDCTDCILMTGSRHNSFEDAPWILRLVDFVGQAYRTSKVRIVGICFGHQIIARAIGGVVGRNPKGWEVSVDRIDLTPTGRMLFGVDSLDLHQMHRDVVLELPKDVANLGLSPTCDFQGLYVPKRIFSIQAHPEFNDFVMSTLLEVRHGQGIFDDELYESGTARKTNPHDGLLVAKTLWRFLLDS